MKQNNENVLTLFKRKIEQMSTDELIERLKTLRQVNRVSDLSFSVKALYCHEVVAELKKRANEITPIREDQGDKIDNDLARPGGFIVQSRLFVAKVQGGAAEQ